MNLFSILTMVGGLALFLYGMEVMGGGLSKASGGRLEHILEKLTSNKLKAVLLGAGVTAVIQSSSATTVMVVGFVNSGIMKLSQAIGIIMGANIGTTVTSWILSLSGIESSNFFVQLVKPSSFSPVLAVIGVALLMFAKKDRQKDVGTILVGFAILMFGMDTMSNAVKPLAEVPEFTRLFTIFSNPILGLIAGALLTAVIQSSSASVGILQALCATGSISFASAVPIILGQNIGTCVTALLSGIGASKNARRAALVHLYFNIIGTVTFMVLFYLVNALIHFSFMGEAANAAGIAIVHTTFNVFATGLLLPFSSMLEKLAYLTIKETPEDGEMKKLTGKEEIQLLDPRFLNTPSFALEQCKTAAVDMINYSKEALFTAMDLLDKYDKKNAERVAFLENTVDHYEDELGTYLVRLSSKHLSERDSQELSVLLHCIGDFERISDHALNIMQASREMHDKELEFSKKALEELKVFTSAIKDIVNASTLVFQEEDLQLARMVEPLEEVVDYLSVETKNRHVKRLRKGKCTIELGFILSDITNNYERVADHCSNIALCLLQLRQNNFETHEMQDAMTSKDNPEFAQEVKRLKEHYRLP